MVIIPLTQAQRAGVRTMVDARRLQVVPVDLSRAASFLRQAEERLGQLPLLTLFDAAVARGIR